MAVIKALFSKPRNARTHLRSVTVTSSQGVTRVRPDALFKDKQFIEKTARLSQIAKRLVTEKEQAAENQEAVTR